MRAKPIMQWRIEQSFMPDTIDLFVYDDVYKNNYPYPQEIESDNSANKFRIALEAHPTAKNINIYINSYGGDVSEGTAMYNMLMRHSAYKKVFIDGFAYSIASIIAMAGDERIMPHNATMLIHNVWGWGAGNAKELRKMADDLEIINEAGKNAYLHRVAEKLTLEKLSELMDNETMLDATQCLAYGLITKIEDYIKAAPPPPAEPPQQKNTINAHNAMMAKIIGGIRL